jgi:hypothetical protein
MPATQSADADNALIRLLLTPEGKNSARSC